MISVTMTTISHEAHELDKYDENNRSHQRGHHFGGQETLTTI